MIATWALAAIRCSLTNLGISGLDVIEMQEVIRQVVGGAHCYKYVFLTPSFELWTIAALSDRVRAIRFADVRHVAQELAYVSSTPQIPNERISRRQYIANLLVEGFRHYSNLGLGAALLGLSRFAEGNRNWRLNPNWDDQGYTAISGGRDEPDYQRGLAEMLKDRPAWLARAATSDQPADEVRMSPAMIDRVVAFGRQVEATGATPVLLLPPLATYWDWWADLLVKFKARCGGTHLLDFDEPTEFPQLYAWAVRYDGGHLNKNGGPVWAELLADRFAAMLDRGKLAGPFCPGS